MLLPVFETTIALVPPILIADGFPRLIPVMVTRVPTGPLSGIKEAILVASAQVTVTMYVFVVPSSAVTNVVMVLSPTAKAMLPEALPLATIVPFTVTVALRSVAVGLRVMDAIALLTEAVYAVVPDAKAGVNVPLLKASAESSATAEGAL